MVNTATPPLRMRFGIKRKVEALIYSLLWDLASTQGRDMREYAFLLGKERSHGDDANVLEAADNPFGRLREALQLFEEHFTEPDDGKPPVSDALLRIIEAANKLDGPMSETESAAVQSELAAA